MQKSIQEIKDEFKIETPYAKKITTDHIADAEEKIRKNLVYTRMKEFVEQVLEEKLKTYQPEDIEYKEIEKQVMGVKQEIDKVEKDIESAYYQISLFKNFNDVLE